MMLLAPGRSAPGRLSPTKSLRVGRAPTRLFDDDDRVCAVTADPASDVAVLPALLDRIATGDSEAFARFYDLTCDRVYGMVLRVLRDPGFSEETTQEVFLQVWRSAQSFDPHAGSALSWLITLAHRRAVDRVRSETAATRRDVNYGLAGIPSTFDEVTEAVESREVTREVVGCLETLTEVQRQSVDLAYYHGLSYREVSEKLSVALPTIKSRIRDGLKRLRQCLGDRDA
ncbi:ECF RNA polymerase sigma factor SigK [Gordonia sp. Z-3]|jgi:RNA polymerase sigma-70 factor (ECF subfamily)|uniref:ECF RNA polymerase sigma factor SigK n=1 Tax=Gordonia sp. Z-3 TaxID=3115408 RepID=UPI003FA5D0A2